MSTGAEIYLWGTRIGYVWLEETEQYASFEYDKDFLNSGIELSPVSMPLSDRVYRFPELSYETFHGMPGLLADSLPDKFGNAVIAAWLASRGRTPDSMNAVERLCYTGKRGMGALEYIPSTGPDFDERESVELDALAEMASRVLENRENIHLASKDDLTIAGLLKLGTSAGGARAKAIVAWNEETGSVRSGQIEAGDGYGYWIVKLDNVKNNGDHGLADELEYTKIEYAYYKMALKAGIIMNECRLLKNQGRAHFMTRRFDRNPVTGDKLHMQSLGAIAHLDYNLPGQCSYEAAALYAKRLGAGHLDIEQLFRRMVFNVVACNLDDHVKNISFLMDRSGKWILAPAYDVTFAYDVQNRWLSAHQMTVNRKRQNIRTEDMIMCGKAMDIRKSRCKEIIEQVEDAVSSWREIALEEEIKAETIESIESLTLKTNNAQVIIEGDGCPS